MPSRGQSNTRRASIADAGSYLSKAREFLRVSSDRLALGNRVAAAGNAVHAGIAAADAIAACRAGVVWKGEHGQAAGHLEDVAGADGRRASTQLRRLLPLKNRAEYDPAPVTHAEVRRAVLAAERIAAIAEVAVASTNAGGEGIPQ